MEEWKEYDITQAPKYPLTELLDFIVDNRGKTAPTANSGIALIATNCIRNEDLYPRFEKIRYVSDETYRTWFRAHPEPGDIIFVNKGTPGRTALVPHPVNFCIAQDMMAFRVKKELIYNLYLLAILRSRDIQQFIINSQVGTIIPHFKKEQLKSLMIPLPPMEVQKRIGDLYYSFSDKIEVNKRINENLEAQAQALFKSWFVDFEPFKNGEFVESELGMIPKGWRVGSFIDNINVMPGGTPSTSVTEYWDKGDIPFFSPKDVDGVYCFETEKKITEEGLNHCSSNLYPKDTLFITARGTVGKLALAALPMAMNQSNYALVAKEGIGKFYLYLLTQTLVAVLLKKANGAVFSAITTKDFKESVVLPPIEIVSKFEDIIKPMFDKIHCLMDESRRFASLRDALLPRLMSGELKVNDINN